ncbi:MAG: hypothetical protein AABZ10_05585 [Nitrospirota bacterium]
MIRYAVSLCLGALLLLMSAAPGASTVYAMGSRDLQTNVPLPALPMFETFLIRSDAPAGELTEIILRLFAENKTLRKLSCERWKDGTRLDCHRRKGDDLFYVYLQPKDNTVRLSIDPQNYEPGYKPDYQYFYRLRDELRNSLEATFGKEQVIQGAERKATAPDDESLKYFDEMLKAPDFASWTKIKEEAILQFAGAEVARKEPPYWARGAFLELTAHQDDVWIVTALAPYPGNTLGDFRWMEITGDGKIIRYHNGTKKDLEWLRSIRMKKRVNEN